MFNRVMLLALFSMLILSVAGCGGAQEPEKASEAAPPPPPKPAEETVEIYELTKDDITSKKDWTSRNIGVLGTKIGDRTNDVIKNLGAIENSRTLADTKEYLTIHQDDGLFVYTFGPTGRIRKFEVYQTFAKKVADPKLQKLLTSGDLKYMRELFGKEEGEPVQNDSDPNAPATEYVYDSRGFRFVQFKVKGQTLNAIRFSELKKGTT